MTKSESMIRVVKIGGSLLEQEDLDSNIRTWLFYQQPMKTVWIVGGGKRADEVRRQEKVGVINSEEAHWLAIEAMEANAKQLMTCFPMWQASHDIESVTQSENSQNVAFFPQRWLRIEDSLPHSWDATSDSIAAALAVVLNADEVVLLKSVLPEGATLGEIARNGVVDSYYPTAASEVSTRIVDLGSADFDEKSFD